MIAERLRARSVVARSLELVRRHPLVVVWLVALVARATYVVFFARSPFTNPDSVEYDAMGRDLVAGRGLVSHTGFIRPPIYPLFVGLTYALGGVAVLQAAQIAIGSTTAVAIGILGRRLSGRRSAGLTAAGVAAIYPWFFQYVGGLAAETLYVLLEVVAFIALLEAVRRGARALLGAGALFALACLARTNLLPVAPAYAAWIWWRTGRFLSAAALAAGVMIALAPFALFHLATGDGLVLASTGGGQLFYQGNNPGLALLYSGTLSDDEWRRLSLNAPGPRGEAFLCPPDGADCVSGIPPAERERYYYAAGLRYIGTETGEWLLLEARKTAHFFTPWVEPRVYSIPIVVASGASFLLVAVLAIAGLRRMDRAAVLFVVIATAGTALTSIAYLVQLRYRFAMLDPVLIAAAGGPIAEVAARVRSSYGRSRSA